MNDDRTRILLRLTKHQDPQVALPDWRLDGVTFDDPVETFCQMVGAVGGQVQPAESIESILADPRFESLLPGPDRRVVSCLRGLPGSHSLESIDDPRELNGLPVAWVEGKLGVAESGAVWINEAAIDHRAALFLAEHLVVVLSTTAIVHNLHQAYSQLQEWNEIGATPWGGFISGPSKTADIEQYLVIGAQGPRAHTVVLVD